LETIFTWKNRRFPVISSKIDKSFLSTSAEYQDLGIWQVLLNVRSAVIIEKISLEHFEEFRESQIDGKGVQLSQIVESRLKNGQQSGLILPQNAEYKESLTQLFPFGVLNIVNLYDPLHLFDATQDHVIFKYSNFEQTKTRYVLEAQVKLWTDGGQLKIDCTAKLAIGSGFSTQLTFPT
jgi:hypothetical protein